MMNPFTQIFENQRHAGVKPEDIIFFWKVNEPFGELSQWHSSTFVCDDEIFSCAEQYMMYRKAVMFGDTMIASKIINTPGLHPNEYRRMGRLVANFDIKTWISTSMSVVINANFCKFIQNDELMQMLMSTGEKVLVEASSTDRIWGIGFSATNAMRNKEVWGQNKLGECLMTVRSMISDTLSRMSSDLSTWSPSQTDMIVMCYHCISTTAVMKPNMCVDDRMAKIMITTCSDCMRLRGLAYGLMNRDELMRMSNYMPEELRSLHNATTFTDMDSTMIIHPSVVRFMNMHGCTIMKARGFKDENGKLTMSWRS